MLNLTKKEIRKLTLSEITKKISYSDIISMIKEYYKENEPEKYKKNAVIFDDSYLYKIISDIASDYLRKMKQTTLSPTLTIENFIANNPSVDIYIKNNFISKVEYEILYLIFHGRLYHTEPLLSHDEIQEIKNKHTKIFALIAKDTEEKITQNIILSDDMKTFLPSLIHSHINICLSIYKDESYIDILKDYLYAETTSTIALMKFLN